MKQNNLHDPATKEDIKNLTGDIANLKDEFVGLNGDLAELRSDFAELKVELTEKIETTGARFRDDILTRLDDIVLQLRDLREDNDVNIHHTRELRSNVDGHEKRIKKIEKVIHIS